jgi:methionine-S-sulfoxide reductase
MEKAIFAAGCFWGVQFYFDQVPGVTKTTVGYTGGHTEKPSYEEVCSHTTGHAEAVEIEFNPAEVSFETLLKQFFRMHDPTQLNRQGPDVGDSYRTAIFYTSDEQKELAEKAKLEAAANFDEPIVTEITKAGTFWPAEDYHQKFTERTGRGMCHIPYEAT